MIHDTTALSDALTPEQIAQGWKLHDGSDVCPIKDDKTVHNLMFRDGGMIRDTRASVMRWRFWGNDSDIIAYRIIEAHGADAEPALPTPATGWLIHKAGRGWYRPNASGYTENVADAGRYSYEDALRRSHPNGMHGPRDGMTIKHESEIEMPAPPRPTPYPNGYDELVWDADGWSQTIIVDGKRPEWLRDDDGISAIIRTDGYSGHWNESWQWELAIRVRRREPKRETRRLAIQIGMGFLDIGTIDLIDGKPDLSTLKIAEGAL